MKDSLVVIILLAPIVCGMGLSLIVGDPAPLAMGMILSLILVMAG